VQDLIGEIEVRLFRRPYSTLEAEIRTDPRLARALDLIESAWIQGGEGDHAINADAMARASAMSRTGFAAAFRARSGFAPYQFLARRRALEAARMIQSTDRDLVDVALDAGFKNITGLERNFRRLLQMAPSQLVKGCALDIP
jgi:AraC-like DNA-binding protein